MVTFGHALFLHEGIEIGTVNKHTGMIINEEDEFLQHLLIYFFCVAIREPFIMLQNPCAVTPG